MAQVVFWSSLAIIAYVYVGYPLYLLARRRYGLAPVDKQPCRLSVSIVIAAYNEREAIVDKLEDCLRQVYPPSKLEIVIALDGPSDGTDRVVERWASAHRRLTSAWDASRRRPTTPAPARGGRGRGPHRAFLGLGDHPWSPLRSPRRAWPAPRLTVVRSPRHEGKAGALNRGVAAARGDVIVFADARQRLESAAVRELIANFHDPEVGAVSGEVIVLDENGNVAGDGIGLYWRYDRWLRALESDIHSLPGATGALHAVRRDLYTPLPADTILDDVAIPMGAVLRGKRAVLDPAARAYDREQPSSAELRRKVRTLAGNYQLLARMPELLMPWRDPIFLQFASHKVGRLVVAFLLPALYASSWMLRGELYTAFLVAQTAAYLLAVVGAYRLRGDRRAHLSGGGGGPQRLLDRLLSVPYHFVMLNWAAVLGLYRYVTHPQDLWQASGAAVAVAPAAGDPRRPRPARPRLLHAKPRELRL